MKRFFHPVRQFFPQSAVVGKLIVTDPGFGGLNRMRDQLFCFREMIAGLPDVFAENDDCVILQIRQIGEVFCVHAGAVKTRFFQSRPASSRIRTTQGEMVPRAIPAERMFQSG